DDAPAGHARLRLGRRPHPRAGLGAAGSRRLALRHRPHRRLDRVRQRRPGGLGRTAHLVGRVLRAPGRRYRGRQVRRSPVGHAVRTVDLDFVPGTILLDVSDPNGDDNGPGNYAYPTSSDFHAGAYDLQRFQVIDSGSDIVFRVQTRDLSPTFGSALGAQLVDVYVHVPGAAQASTAASFPQRNYSIAAPFAWSRLIEVQGFGQRYIDAT